MAEFSPNQRYLLVRLHREFRMQTSELKELKRETINHPLKRAVCSPAIFATVRPDGANAREYPFRFPGGRSTHARWRIHDLHLKCHAADSGGWRRPSLGLQHHQPNAAPGHEAKRPFAVQSLRRCVFSVANLESVTGGRPRSANVTARTATGETDWICGKSNSRAQNEWECCPKISWPPADRTRHRRARRYGRRI